MMKKERISEMDKNQIIEIAFETIRESTEWGIEEEDCKSYGHFIDGVVTVVDNILSKIKEVNNGKPVKN